MPWAHTITEHDGTGRMSARTTTRPARIEVLTGPERRRRRRIEQKRAIVAESRQSGASPAMVARRHGVSTGQLYTWRRQLAGQSAPAYARVELAGGDDGAARPSGVIEIVLPNGVIVRTDARTSEGALRRVLAALRG